MTNYPPGVTNQNFDELYWNETYKLGRSCIVCLEPLPDQADNKFCSYCEPELLYGQRDRFGREGEDQEDEKQ